MSGPFHVPWALLTHQPLAEPHSAVDVVGAGPELLGAIRSQRGAAPCPNSGQRGRTLGEEAPAHP